MEESTKEADPDMSVLTVFFVASREKLSDVLPAWLPVADEPSTRVVQNPFTGLEQVATIWEPAANVPISDSADSSLPNFHGVSHAQFKRVDHVKLAQLNVILAGGTFADRMTQFHRPALIDPAQSDETGLHRLDDGFLTALAETIEINTAAERWLEIEEMELDQFTLDDCCMVFGELIRLARDAKASGKNLYFWWSL